MTLVRLVGLRVGRVESVLRGAAPRAAPRAAPGAARKEYAGRGQGRGERGEGGLGVGGARPLAQSRPR